MTAVEQQTTLEPATRRWAPVVVLAVLSTALVVLAFITGASTAYLVTLTVVVAVVGGAIAVYDARTLTLPNRFTGPLAAGAAVQLVTVAMVTYDAWQLAAGLIAAVALFAVYAALGFAGHVGFGDAKFAAGLGLIAAIPAGLAAVYLLPVALLIGGSWRGIRLIMRRPRTPQPHGPALAIATVLVMGAGILFAS